MGGGPVGLTAAISLVEKGVHVRIIDENAEPAIMTKAPGTHGRALEQLPAKVVAAMQASALNVTLARAWETVDGRAPTALVSVDMRGKSDTYEGMLAQEQSVAHGALPDRVSREPPGRTRRPHEDRARG